LYAPTHTAFEAYSLPGWVGRYLEMKTSPIGIDLIHSFEQFRSKAYKDSGGVPTIGWGSTRIFGRQVRMNDRITRKQADFQFEKDLYMFEEFVKLYVKVPINQNQFDALVSLCYNIGQGNLKRSRVIERLNNGKVGEAAQGFMRHVYARHRKTKKLLKLKGLVRRREAEKQLFLTPESGHHLFELVENLKPRGLSRYVFNWQNKRYNI